MAVPNIVDGFIFLRLRPGKERTWADGSIPSNLIMVRASAIRVIHPITPMIAEGIPGDSEYCTIETPFHFYHVDHSAREIALAIRAIKGTP